MGKKKVTPLKMQPGPKPETLKIEGDWKDAMKKALGRGKPTIHEPASKKESGS